MHQPKRKPPAKVLSLHTGSPLEPDAITDEDFREAVTAQDNVLYAQGHERRVLGKLRVRIERGAVQASTLYYFDLDRGIVRRRERAARSRRIGPKRERGQRGQAKESAS